MWACGRCHIVRCVLGNSDSNYWAIRYCENSYAEVLARMKATKTNNFSSLFNICSQFDCCLLAPRPYLVLVLKLPKILLFELFALCNSMPSPATR